MRRERRRRTAGIEIARDVERTCAKCEHIRTRYMRGNTKVDYCALKPCEKNKCGHIAVIKNQFTCDQFEKRNN